MTPSLDCKSRPLPRVDCNYTDNCSCVTFGLLGASLIPMMMLVNSTPDQIPADEIAQHQNDKTTDIEVQKGVDAKN